MIALIAAYYYIRLFLSSSFHYVISDRCRMIRREDERHTIFVCRSARPLLRALYITA